MAVKYLQKDWHKIFISNPKYFQELVKERNLNALYASLMLAMKDQANPNRWMLEACLSEIVKVIKSSRPTGPGRAGNEYSAEINRERQLARWDKVRELKRKQVPSKDVFEQASLQLSGTKAQGAANTVRDSYLIIKKNEDTKSDRFLTELYCFRVSKTLRSKVKLTG